MGKLVKVRVNQCQIEVFGRGHFDEGVIVEIDEELAKQYARWNQVTILADEEAPPPIKPKIPSGSPAPKVDRMVRKGQVVTR